MATFASVRGWLEGNELQLEEVRGIVSPERHLDEAAELYAGGWAFPRKRFNWGDYCFYGGDIKAGYLSIWFYPLLEEIAAIAADRDGDEVRGLFLVSVQDDSPGNNWSKRRQDPSSVRPCEFLLLG